MDGRVDWFLLIAITTPVITTATTRPNSVIMSKRRG